MRKVNGITVASAQKSKFLLLNHQTNLAQAGFTLVLYFEHTPTP